jgi:hypothetical protein
MQFKQTLVRLLFILFPYFSLSQTTYLPQGDKANILMERMEIKTRSDSFFNFSKTKPFSRRHLVNAANHFSALNMGKKLSKTDQHNLQSVTYNNTEYAIISEHTKFYSKKPILKHFYKTPANLYEVHVKDFDLIINPVIQYTLSKENDNDQDLFLNTRGVSVRGRIANKIGFAAYITDNQERDPLYVQQFVNERKAVPGAGFYKPFKAAGGVDYFDARGYFTFNVTRYIDVTFGYEELYRQRPPVTIPERF